MDIPLKAVYALSQTLVEDDRGNSYFKSRDDEKECMMQLTYGHSICCKLKKINDLNSAGCGWHGKPVNSGPSQASGSMDP